MTYFIRDDKIHFNVFIAAKNENEGTFGRARSDIADELVDIVDLGADQVILTPSLQALTFS